MWHNVKVNTVIQNETLISFKTEKRLEMPG